MRFLPNGRWVGRWEWEVCVWAGKGVCVCQWWRWRGWQREGRVVTRQRCVSATSEALPRRYREVNRRIVTHNSND